MLNKKKFNSCTPRAKPPSINENTAFEGSQFNQGLPSKANMFAGYNPTHFLNLGSATMVSAAP
jgi:hypothetical protein